MHPLNAKESMAVTVSASVTEVRLVQHRNTFFSTLFIVRGRVMEVSDLQSRKAPAFIWVSWLGSVREVRDIQPPNACSPIVLRFCGRVREERDVQR